MNRTPFQDWQRNQRRIAVAARVGKFVVALMIVGLLASAVPW